MLSFTDGLENAIHTLAKVEGESWAKTQWEPTGYTVAILYEAWCKMQQDPDWKEFCEEYPRELVEPKLMDLSGGVEIYGESGWTRYVVISSGEVLASRYHMPPESKKTTIIDSLGIGWW